LDSDSRIYITESGTEITGPDVDGSWGLYSGGDQFRITLRANLDGTAEVIYSKALQGSLSNPFNCYDGQPCLQDVIHQHTLPVPSYPFRVDTSLRDEGATLANVDIMRIYIQ
jgi:hypothetical protein